VPSTTVDFFRAVFSKDIERKCPMRTRQLDRRERMEELLEKKNAVIYGAGIGGVPSLGPGWWQDRHDHQRDLPAGPRLAVAGREGKELPVSGMTNHARSSADKRCRA
jgi:hypothetical protein